MNNLLLELNKVHIGYGNKPILSDLNLRFEAQKMYVIIGNNGAGKSTLLKSILGQIPLIGGEILLAKKSITNLGSNERAKLIAYVPSKNNYVSGISVRDVLHFGRIPYASLMGRFNNEDHKIVEKTVSLLQLEDLLDRKFEQLSDGQQQKVRIARVLIQDTPLVVLDEPTSHLDIGQKALIFKLLHELAKNGKTIICATHDVHSVVDFAHEVLFFSSNKTVEVLCRPNINKEAIILRLEQ